MDFTLDVGVEEGLADDAQGKQQHFFADVDHRAVAPTCGHLLGVVGDYFAVGRDSLAMKGGLGEAALTHVKGFFAGEQAIAEHHSGTLHDQAAVVAMGIADEQVVDQIGVVELQSLDAEGLEVDEVSKLFGVGFHERGCILTEGHAAQKAGQEGGPDGLQFAGLEANIGRDGEGFQRPDDSSKCSAMPEPLDGASKWIP